MNASVTYTCPRCQEQSTDPRDCSECGAPMAAPVATPAAPAPRSGSVPAAGGPITGSARQAVRATGYSDVTGRASSARRPQAGSASFATGTGTGTGAATGTTAHRGSRGSSTRRRMLGGGLIQMPVIPSQDPLLKIMANPRVPESKCFCPNPACKAPVRPDKKFCPNCGAEYSFQPKLKAGDLVAGQYRVRGPIAFGGLGWIYLAQDEKVSDRWVVLKGLLNTKDADSAAAAIAERQFLAAIKHGKIIGIYNFVLHEGEGYIVMEYVGGRSALEVRKENGPFPADQAMAYIIGILPAIQYLHEQKLVYCDFSPDNIMLEGDDVKLIDLGAVRRIGDPDGGVFFKWGYMAPEGIYDPYEPSDLFTVGRTLAFLVTDMNTRQTGPMRKAIPAEPFASRGVKVEDAKRWTAKLKDGSGLPAWLKFDAAAMSLSGQAPPGVLQITVAVTALGADGKPLADRHGDAATIPFDIVLPLALPEPQEIHFDVPLPRFARESLDVKGQLSWTVALADGSALPAWLKWDAKKTAFSGWAPDGVGSVGVMVTAADGAGKKASVPFTIRLPFVESESLYRLLLKATAYDANARFQTAEEMLSQLTGVLRELVAQRGPIPSADDPEFLRERAVPGLDPALTDGMWRRLPDLRIDEADTARSEVFAAAGTSDPEERVKLLSAIAKQKPDSGEARLRCAGLMIEGGSPAEDRIMRLLDQAAAIDQWDWRPDWYCGLMRLALGQGAEAVESFDRVYGEVPGSAAPKLALAMALEMAGRRDEAAGLYDRVSRADPAMPAASFGLARCRAASGDRAGAVDAYSRVPSGSAVYSDAQLAAALTLVESSHLGSPSADDLMSASGILTALPREDIPRHVAEVALLLEAVALIEGSPKAAKDVRLLGVPMRQRDLRLRAEQALKACGRLAKTAAERIAYVDLANSVRPRTTW